MGPGWLVAFGLASAGPHAHPDPFRKQETRVQDLFQETRPIKAISLWEPWASLVARGVKRHETRHWSTDYRGPIAICAAKTLDRAGAPDRLCQSALGIHWWTDRPAGAVLAVAELTEVRRAGDIV